MCEGGKGAHSQGGRGPTLPWPQGAQPSRRNSAGTGAGVTGVPGGQSQGKITGLRGSASLQGTLAQSRHDGQRRFPRALRNLDMASGHTNSKGQKNC